MRLDFSIAVMVVDDSETMLKIMSSLLKQIGYENVETVDNGKTALEKLSEKRYGLVISDWNMQPVSGYELLCSMRRRSEFSGIPFIMVTAEAKTENVVSAKKAGVNNYIVKPFNADSLKAKIDSVFAVA